MSRVGIDDDRRPHFSPPAVSSSLPVADEAFLERADLPKRVAGRSSPEIALLGEVANGERLGRPTRIRTTLRRRRHALLMTAQARDHAVPRHVVSQRELGHDRAEPVEAGASAPH